MKQLSLQEEAILAEKVRRSFVPYDKTDSIYKKTDVVCNV